MKNMHKHRVKEMIVNLNQIISGIEKGSSTKDALVALRSNLMKYDRILSKRPLTQLETLRLQDLAMLVVLNVKSL